MTASTDRGVRVEDLFTGEAERYDAAYDADTRAGRLLRARLVGVLERVGSGDGAPVLDVGMGTGRLCAELERRGWVVSGVDPTAAMVELARQRLMHGRERLIRARAEALPFGDASFGAVVSTGALEYVDDLPRALHELARVLQPGGLAVVSFPHFHAPLAFARRSLFYPAVRAVKRVVRVGRAAPIPPLHPLGRAALARALEQAGLGVESVDYVGPRLGRQLVVTARKGRSG